MSANKWLAAICMASKSKIEKVPKGWNTRDQIAKQIGKSKSTTRDYIKKLILMGKAEKKDFYIYIPARRASTPIPHYKIK